MVVFLLHTESVTGSNPVITTNQCIASVMAALQSPKLSVGVRVPGGTPNIPLVAQWLEQSADNR